MIFYFPSAFLTIALYLAELAEAEVSILNGSNKKLKKRLNCNGVSLIIQAVM